MSGLLDGIFSNEKIQIWVNFGGHWNGKCPFGIHILQPIGLFSGYLVHFFKFWYVEARKIWQPWCRQQFFKL
jgi:hypothetical protein